MSVIELPSFRVSDEVDGVQLLLTVMEHIAKSCPSDSRDSFQPFVRAAERGSGGVLEIHLPCKRLGRPFPIVEWRTENAVSSTRMRYRDEAAA